MVSPRQKSELLSNIEDLWLEAAAQSAEAEAPEAPQAENNLAEDPQTTFQRISMLMETAMTTAAANDMDEASTENMQTAPAEQSAPDHQSEDDTIITALAGLVEEAVETAPTPPSDQDIPSFEQVKSQIDDVSQLKPPQADSYNSNSPEYAFGNAFTNLVRHVVRDYIHNEVEGVIRNAIKSELDAHFSKVKNTSSSPQGDDHNDERK